MEAPSVGIVGGGITGLGLLHYLSERSVEAVCFEATPEAGGVIDSRRVDGHVLEAGPQRLRKTPGVASLLADLSLAEAVIEADEALPLFVHADGHLGVAPLDRAAFLRTDLLSRRAKLRLLAEPLTRAGSPEETAAELFTRKFGREAYERFIGPLYGGIYGSDPARMPAKYALEGLLEHEREAGSLLSAFRQRIGGGGAAPPMSFEDGLQTLPNALAAAHADRVRLETPVNRVERADSGGFLLRTTEASIAVDHVVVTTPAAVAAELLEPVASHTDGLASLTYNPLAIVHLLAEVDRDGMGYQVAFGADLHTLGCTWNASLFDRDGVFTVFLGGMHEPDLVEESDERLASIATREFRTVMGSEATAINVVRLDPGFPAYDESWRALEDLTLPEGVHLATNYTARMGIPSRLEEARTLAETLTGRVGPGDGGAPTE